MGNHETWGDGAKLGREGTGPRPERKTATGFISKLSFMAGNLKHYWFLKCPLQEFRIWQISTIN